MAAIVLSALSSAFFFVRIVKGPWMRNPQYVAAATIGGVALSLGLYLYSPSLENNLIVSGLVGAAGAWAGIAAFDLI